MNEADVLVLPLRIEGHPKTLTEEDFDLRRLVGKEVSLLQRLVDYQYFSLSLE